jgi:enoyl-CoA hydratase
VAGVLEYALQEEFACFDTPEHQDLVKAFLARSTSRAAKAQG